MHAMFATFSPDLINAQTIYSCFVKTIVYSLRHKYIRMSLHPLTLSMAAQKIRKNGGIYNINSAT